MTGYFSPAAAFDFERRGELIKSPIMEPEMIRPVYLATKPSRSLSRACRAVEQITLDVACDIVNRGIWDGTLINSSESTGS